MKHQSMKDRMDERHGMRHSHHESHGIYRNEVEKPSMPMEGHMEKGMGCESFKNEADPIALGQAGQMGMREDEGRMHSQFKNYGWN